MIGRQTGGVVGRVECLTVRRQQEEPTARHAIELLDEVEIATELEHWMLADRMMRSEERAET